MDREIPDKLYFKIGEVAELTGVKPHVLRYWESEFRVLNPPKSRSKQRLYRKQDIEKILQVKDLLYKQGFTIAGARKQIRSLSRQKPADNMVQPSPRADAEASPQLPLQFSPPLNRPLLNEIRQDVVNLRKSLGPLS
ncbi:MAG: MerR family transcriptional regulator [Desulfuromonas sp.]|nr:MAG: MerR family transcriptional regulator [Desulfuromonas sp.]